MIGEAMYAFPSKCLLSTWRLWLVSRFPLDSLSCWCNCPLYSGRTHKSNMGLPTASYCEGYQVSGVDGGGHHWENLSRMESVKIQWDLLMRYSNLRLLDPIWSSHCYSWWRMSQLYTRIEDQGLTWKMSEVFSPAQFWTVFSRNWYMSEPVRGRISGIITSSSTESSITQSQPRPGLSILRCWTTSNIGVNDDLLNLTYDCDSLSKVAVKTPAGITKRVDVQKVVTQGEVITPWSVPSLWTV